MNNMNIALQLLGQGMAGIFAVLGLIAIFVVIMQCLDHRKRK